MIEWGYDKMVSVYGYASSLPEKETDTSSLLTDPANVRDLSTWRDGSSALYSASQATPSAGSCNHLMNVFRLAWRPHYGVDISREDEIHAKTSRVTWKKARFVQIF